MEQVQEETKHRRLTRSWKRKAQGESKGDLKITRGTGTYDWEGRRGYQSKIDLLNV